MNIILILIHFSIYLQRGSNLELMLHSSCQLSDVHNVRSVCGWNHLWKCVNNFAPWCTVVDGVMRYIWILQNIPAHQQCSGIGSDHLDISHHSWRRQYKKARATYLLSWQADQRVLLVYTVTMCVCMQSTYMQYCLYSELLSARLVWLIQQSNHETTVDSLHEVCEIMLFSCLQKYQIFLAIDHNFPHHPT